MRYASEGDEPSHAREQGVDHGGEIDTQSAVIEKRAKHNPQRFSTIDKTKHLKENQKE
jgi:hypothetical protein